MQFEDFDKKVKEAADNHHPTYNENAWERMEKLLDKHLPQKRDDRRRFIFFILLPLLMTGGVWLIISKPWSEKEKEKVTVAVGQIQTPQSNSDEPGKNAIIQPDNNNPVPATDNEPSVSSETNTTAQNIISGELPVRRQAKPSGNLSGLLAGEEFETIVGVPGVRRKGEGKDEVKIKEDVENKNVVQEKNQEKNKEIEEVGKLKSQEQTAKDEVAKAEKNVEAVAENKQESAQKEKTKKKKGNEFFFTVSAGPDISSVGSSDPGNTKLVIGAGVGYTFMDRLTLRAGFYSARKMYSANKEDYKPAVTPPNYYYLDNIEADCKVYEIPVTLSYRFGKSTKHHFFAGAGLSSYIMKEEVYDYHYKYPGNPPVTYSHTYTYNNEYKHFFSVLGISGGYQRNLSPTVGISAEPYIRIPLSGVGAGNVKLKSAGVLFSVSIKPFK